MGDVQFWERVVGGHFVLPRRSFWPNFFSRIVARLQWDPAAIDFTTDAQNWPTLPDERRARLMTMNLTQRRLARVECPACSPLAVGVRP